jgi:hypothetical protein
MKTLSHFRRLGGNPRGTGAEIGEKKISMDLQRTFA